jgi:hypothetical protein
MAQLTPDQFAAKWTPLLANNVFQDIDGVRLGQLVVDIKDSFGASTAAVNVPDWIAGTFYPLGYLILRSFGGPAIFMQARKADYLPVPTDALGDANWAPALGPVVAGTYQMGTVLALQHSQGDWVPGRLYVLLNRLDANGDPLPDVYVRALAASTLEPEGFTLDPAGLVAAVSYELGLDQASPREAAGDRLVNVAVDSASRLPVGVRADGTTVDLGQVLVGTSGEQTISDLKYFLTLPRAIGTPTAPEDLVPKRYVDALASGATSSSYAQLKASRGSWVAGKWYILTDYQLTHVIAGTSVTYTSYSERLLLLATSPTTFGTDGYSLTYPSDKVVYYFDNDNARVPGCTKGYVGRRHDTVQNNDLEIDFRNVVFRRWSRSYGNGVKDYYGRTASYVATSDTGLGFYDSPMFQEYFKVLNNRWFGFDFRFRPSIFDNINFTAEARVVNTTVQGSSVLKNVAIGYGWFKNSVLINSTMENVSQPPMYFSTFLNVTMLSSTLTNRPNVESGDNQATLIATNLTTEPISGLVYVAGNRQNAPDVTTCTARCGDEAAGQPVALATVSGNPVAPLAATYDPGANFNAARNCYVARQRGLYEVVATVRFADQTPAGLDYVLAAGKLSTSAGRAQVPGVTAGKRPAQQLVARLELAAGEECALLVQADSFTPTVYSSFSITLLRAL